MGTGSPDRAPRGQSPPLVRASIGREIQLSRVSRIYGRTFSASSNPGYRCRLRRTLGLGRQHALFLQKRLQLAGLEHFSHDIAAAYELALDV